MPFNTKMTAINNEIRDLSGATGPLGLDAMASNLREVNAEVGNQADLIAQIVEVLDSKAVGGGSGSGSSGSSGNTQTASVTIVIDAPIGLDNFVYYVSPSGLNTIDIIDYSISSNTFSFDCVVPSIIFATVGFVRFDGEISELYRASGVRSYYITGRSTLTIA